MSVFVVSCLLALLFSCRRERGERQLLDDVEQTWQLCETSVAEAVARADALEDTVRKASELVRQRFDLLCLRLRDKQDFVPSSPDSAIRVASYFEGREEAIDAERACYYLGSAYRDLKDYPRAVGMFLKTVGVAESGGDVDTLIWQNALSQLRFLYMLELNYEEELDVAMQAVALAKASGSSEVTYLMDVASAYSHLNDTLHCLLYCDMAFKSVCEAGFPKRLGSVMSHLMALYSDYGHYEKAEPLLLHLSRLPEAERPHNYELCLARYHESQHRTDSAIAHYIIYYSLSGSASGRYEAAAGLQRCHLSKGNFRQAALWGQHLYETNDSIIAQRAFEQTQRAKDAYRYHRDMEAESAIRQRDERIVFLALIAGLTLLSLVLGLLALYHFRRKKYMEEIVSWKRLLEEKALINKELTRIALFNNAKEKADYVSRQFHEIAEGRAKATPTLWRDLTTAIETLYPGFIEDVQLREGKPLREPLLHTICLMKLGLRPVQITRVMDAKIQTVWNRVKRAEELCGDLLAPEKP